MQPDVCSVSYQECHSPQSMPYTMCIISASERNNIEISRDVSEILTRYRDYVYADDI